MIVKSMKELACDVLVFRQTGCSEDLFETSVELARAVLAREEANESVELGDPTKEPVLGNSCTTPREHRIKTDAMPLVRILCAAAATQLAVSRAMLGKLYDQESDRELLHEREKILDQLCDKLQEIAQMNL